MSRWFSQVLRDVGAADTLAMNRYISQLCATPLAALELPQRDMPICFMAGAFRVDENVHRRHVVLPGSISFGM